jgi:protoporphyrinogen oxidase
MKKQVFIVVITIVILIGLPLAEDLRGEPFDAIIVGGGIAGMTAAYVLREQNIKVLEKRSQVGGRAYSGKYKGFTYARGTEYLGEPEGILKKIISELDLKLREIPYPADVNIDKGKLYYGEMGKALLLIKKSSLAEYNRFMKTILKVYEDYEDIPDLDMKSEIAKLDNVTARQWFEDNQFPQIFIDSYNVTFKGLFGATIDEISALSALTEIAFDFYGEEAVEDIEDLENDGTPGKYETGMFSFNQGISEIPIAIANNLKNKVQLNSTVTKVTRNGDLFKVYYQGQDKKEYFYESYSVVLATPAAISYWIGKEVLTAEQKRILKKVEYAPYLTVALFSESPIFNKGFDLALPSGTFFTDVYDATWIERYYNEELKNKKAWITTIYIAPNSYKDRSILSLSDIEITNKIYSHLEPIFPNTRKKVKKIEVNRFKYAYPVMTLGAYKRLTHLHEITNNGLYLAGDFMTYPTFEAAAVSGQLAAEKALDWALDD